MHIGTLTNTEDGLQSITDQIAAAKFRVVFRDIDADETVEAERFVHQWEAVNATRRSMERAL
jgi:hypothetical protein